MSKLSYVLEGDSKVGLNLSPITTLKSVEDVSTLLEAYKDVKEEVGFARVSGVNQVADSKGSVYYVFTVLAEGVLGGFDFLDFVKEMFVDSDKVFLSACNVGNIFKASLSRGIYEYQESLAGATNDAEEDGDYYDDDDVATGFLGEDDLDFSDLEPSQGIALENKKTVTKTEIPLTGGIVGRSRKSADIVIDSKNIGRNHCRLMNLGGEWFVNDSGSLNGTFLNGEQCLQGQKIPLAIGDLLKLADETFTVVSAEQ